MVPPVRWYYILSTWIFIASATYPFHRISTFPLNLLASVGCLEVILNPHKESWVKNLYILALHIVPFFWIPRDLSKKTIEIAIVFVIVYLLFIVALKENVFHVYMTLLDEDHPTAAQFVCDRFGVC